MIEITPTRLHWIDDDGSGDPDDYCAHSPVSFVVDGQALITPDAGDWAVNISALYLLRTLDSNFVPREHDQLFPCCGHVPAVGTDGRFFNIGCPDGVDLRIDRSNHGVIITTDHGAAWKVPDEEWRDAVTRFADMVEVFYAGSPKEITDSDDRSAMAEFWREWGELRAASGRS